jgi:hypothetical protein
MTHPPIIVRVPGPSLTVWSTGYESGEECNKNVALLIGIVPTVLFETVPVDLELNMEGGPVVRQQRVDGICTEGMARFDTRDIREK